MPGRLRRGVQEQGRAAAARRGRGLPAVADRHPVGRRAGARQGRRQQAERPADDKAPFSALAFKIMTDPFVGQLTFIRVYSGVMQSGGSVYNATKDKTERVGRLLKMHANKREEIKEVYAGDIAAAVGLRSVTHRRHDLRRDSTRSCSSRWTSPSRSSTSRSSRRRRPTRRSWGRASASCRPRTRRSACAPTTRPARSSSPGMGELHLEIIVDRLKREFSVEASVGRPQVAYKETLTKAAVGRGPLHPPDRRPRPVRPREDPPRAAQARRGVRVRQRDRGRHRSRASTSSRSRRASARR